MDLQTYLLEVFQLFYRMSFWVGSCIIGCAILTRITPCNRDQPFFHKGMVTDLLYYYFMPFIGAILRNLLLGLGIAIVYHGATGAEITDYIHKGYGPLGSMPIWLQAAVIFVVADFLLYWIHRFFHGKVLWKFHAIHHSPKHVDWLTTYRFHPINVWLSFTLVDILMLMVGFSVEAIACMTAFNMLYSVMVHSNLNWTFGPFKYCFASPVFHRWHHTSQAEGMDKNFAPTFPLLDIIFGTFYMPDGEVPKHYGIHDKDFPEHNILKQLIYPFVLPKKPANPEAADSPRH